MHALHSLRHALPAALLTLAPLAHAQSTVPVGTDSAAARSTALLARADTAAATTFPFGWLARGVVAGAIAGPIGAVWIARRAEGSTVDDERFASPPAPLTSPADRDTTATAYREAFVARVRAERKEYALVGGIVGTAALFVAILKLSARLRDQAATSGVPGGGSPGFTLIPPPPALLHLPLSRNR
jgi:hypothetical protein